MNKQRYPEEFKIKAVKQITERGHKVADVSAGFLEGGERPVFAALLPSGKSTIYM